MTKLRKSAQGRECQIRIPGVCNGNPETTVLAHLNGGGMGRKQPDLFGAFSCSACHDAVDGRSGKLYTPVSIEYTAEYVMHLEGVIRTQQIWLDEGWIGELPKQGEIIIGLGTFQWLLDLAEDANPSMKEKKKLKELNKLMDFP